MPELTDLLSRLTEDQPPVGITRESTIAAGRQARNRRRGLVGAAVATLAVAIGAAVTLSPTTGPPARPADRPARVPVFAVSRLPMADVPGAIQRPDLVAGDRRVFHFALTWATTPDRVTYATTDGVEIAFAGSSAVIVTRDRTQAELLATPQTDDGVDAPLERRPVTVNGRPGSLTSSTEARGLTPFRGLVWDPVDGLSVAVTARGPEAEATIWTLVDGLRLDQAQRCVTPFTLTDIPAGLRLRECQSGVPGRGGAYGVSGVKFGDATGGNQISVSVGVDDEPALEPGRGAPRTVAGHPAQWFDGQTRALRSQNFDRIPVTVGVQGSFGEADATRVLAGLRLAEDRAGPLSWPTDPAPGVP